MTIKNNTKLCRICCKPIAKRNKEFCSRGCINRFYKPKTKKRICVECKKSFSRRPSDQTKFCSQTCMGHSMRKKFYVKCKTCGIKFKTYKCLNRIFCSRICSGYSFRKPVREITTEKINCLKCKQIFIAIPSSNRKYCSLKCAYSSKKRTEATGNKQRKDRGSRICIGCNLKYKIETYNAKSKHCSHSCFLTNNPPIPKDQVETKCSYCGSVFSHQRSRKAIFCSRKCMHKDGSWLKKGLQTQQRNRKSKDRYYKTSTKSYSRGKGGIRKDLEIYVRSSWEANYCRYLNLLIKQKKILIWEYESKTFIFENNNQYIYSYTPDFKVFNINGSYEWHEVKGWMDKKSALKIEYFRRDFPNEVLKIIDQTEYNKIFKFKHLIPNYE